MDYYIFQEQFKVFLISLFTIQAMLLLEKVNFLSNLFLARNTSFETAGLLILYLCPAFLTLAAPLAVLMSSLMAFSRMSADNEITAMRAGGLSFARLLAPVIFFSALAAGATLYLSVNYAHEGNLRFQQTAIKILSQSVQSEIKERRFYSEFPGLMIYVNENRDGLLRGVFISDQRSEGRTSIIEAKTGMMESDQQKGILTMELRDGVIHTAGQNYTTIGFKEYFLKMDLGARINQPLEKETPQMSIPELREEIRKKGAQGKPSFREQVEIHKKYAIPLGCLALGALGALAGVMTQRRGSGGGLGMGVILIVINYLLIMIGQGLGS
ncbi:MAG: LptF/LptG family permease, partial [Nitrospinota bacterium]|nr:LptF/LptG family permease [Nitrospinota bacterium]